MSEIPLQWSQNCISTTKILPSMFHPFGSISDWQEPCLVSRFCCQPWRNIQITTVFRSFLIYFILFSPFLLILTSFLSSFPLVNLSRNHSLLFISSKCPTLPTFYTATMGTGGSSCSSTKVQDGREQSILCHWIFLILGEWVKVYEREMSGIHSCHCSSARNWNTDFS